MSSANPESPRSIELEVEVVGTPEQVWEAIATARGISSWYVPHTMEEREGGVVRSGTRDADSGSRRRMATTASDCL